MNPTAEWDYGMASSAPLQSSDALTTTSEGRSIGWRGFAVLVMLLASITARWIAHANAGGLWRDEIHSVNMATAPTDDLFYVLTYDSFPVLWQVLLRGWISLFGSTDLSVRALGLLSGLAVVPALWWMTRQLGLSFPWWSMLLLGIDPTLIIFGGEVRGYGLGVVTLLVLIGVSWNALQHPSIWQWTALMVTALLAVQSSYTNCFLLAATFIGCGVVALSRRRYLVCVGFGTVGILSAASMLPYAIYVLPRLSAVIKPFLPSISSWTRVRVFRNTLAWGGIAREVIWCVIGAIATREVYRRVCSRTFNQRPQSESDQNLALFAMTFFWVSTVGFWWYMNFLGAHTANWYYMPYLTVLAVTTEIGIQLWLKRRPRRENWGFRLALVASVLVCAEVASTLPYRMTSVDLVARNLSSRVREGDLVLVMPWWYGIPFDRYYNGPAKWMTLPDVDHDRQHNGYQELYQRVMRLPPAEAIQSELAQIDAVLLAGGKIWWVGPPPYLPPGEEPLQLTAAPDPKYGWSETAYFTAWQHMVFQHMQAIGVTTSEHLVPRPKLINVLEDPPVYVFQPSRAELKLSASE